MKQDFQKGAVPYSDGCKFAVWAPNAEEVFLMGSFNDWNKSSLPMEDNPEGIWTLDVEGARPGDEYRYRILRDGAEHFRIDPYARRVTSSIGNTIITAPLPEKKYPGFQPPPHNQLVIYELHIGTFGKVKGQPGPGNLKGAAERLPYLHELGINAIELMPLAEFAGGYSWGYNPAHIFAVESDYGTPEDLKAFVDAAHKLGMAVIKDVVYNHFGPTDLHLWQFDGWSENDKGGIYFYNDWRAETPWGDTRPDYGRPEVREYIRDNALMWVQDYGMDGLRFDGSAYIRNVYGHNDEPENDLPEGWTLMQWLNEEIVRVKPNAILIAEDLKDNHFLTLPQQEGGAGFRAQWCGQFVHTIRGALIEPDDAERDMHAVQAAIQKRYHGNAFERVIYTESHDEVANGKARLAEEVDPGQASSWAAKKKSTLGAALVFTAPGIPMLFQGQEFLEDDWFHDQNAIDWGKVERFSGILAIYKDLAALRLNCSGLTKGLTGQRMEVYHINQEDKLLAYHRWEEGGPKDSVVVVVNFSTHQREGYWIGFPIEGEWAVRFNSDSKVYENAFGDLGSTAVHAGSGEQDGLPARGQISISGYSALILSQEKG
jgi:1,4-alpha-glucan branching enzyme